MFNNNSNVNNNKTNYKNFSNNKQVVREPIKVDQVLNIEQHEEKVEEVVNKEILGITNSKLNLRKEPNGDAEILVVLGDKEEITIIDKDTNTEFYKVVTVHGIEGYCMKKFVTVKE